MRRVDITLGLFPRDRTSHTRYSLKGLWQKSWSLQIYLGLTLWFLGDLGNPWNAPTFPAIFCQAFRRPATRGDRPKPAGGTAWNCRFVCHRCSQIGAFLNECVFSPFWYALGGILCMIFCGHSFWLHIVADPHSYPMSWYVVCQPGWLQMSTGHCSSPSTCLEINKGMFFFSNFGWCDKHRFSNLYGVNWCKLQILWIFPLFSLSSGYLTCYGRLHSPACDAAPPWDPDLSWPAWCAACAWISCPKSRFFQKKQVAKISRDFGPWLLGQIHGFEGSMFSG